MPRFKDREWNLTHSVHNDDQIYSWDLVPIAVLMDIRDELKQLNRLLHCPNFTSIPHKLESIRKNTTKKRKKGNR